MADEAHSKRHSASELGSISYSDVRKEGWLHYKQIHTEKGKVRQEARLDTIITHAGEIHPNRTDYTCICAKLCVCVCACAYE